MSRFGTYLENAKLMRLHIEAAEDVMNKDHKEATFKHNIVGALRAMHTALNNVASMQFEKKRPRRRKVIRGGFLKGPFIAAMLLMVVMGSGCTQFKRLTGSEPKEKEHVENIGGVWGGTLELDGNPAHAGFIIIQNGNQITSEGFFSINYSQYGYAHLSGTVSGRTFTMRGRNGTQCPNDWEFSGEVNGGTMVVNVNTIGNNVLGTSCYPRPVNQTIAMSH